MRLVAISDTHLRMAAADVPDGDVLIHAGDLTLHGTLADALLILAGIHASAALVHHWIWRDRTLSRMLPGARFVPQRGRRRAARPASS